MKLKVIIVDYGLGNIRSAEKSISTAIKLNNLDGSVSSSSNYQAIKDASHIVLPGQGAFKSCMNGLKNISGMIEALEECVLYNKVPFLGICLGMQAAVIEYSRNVLGLNDANSTEFNSKTSAPVIALITEWQNSDGSFQNRDENSELGGTMRLGAQECLLQEGTNARVIYGNDSGFERHRHRYEFNSNYRNQLEEHQLTFSGFSKDGLAEMIEIKDHPWFVGVQFHPESIGTPEGKQLLKNFLTLELATTC